MGRHWWWDNLQDLNNSCCGPSWLGNPTGFMVFIKLTVQWAIRSRSLNPFFCFDSFRVVFLNWWRIRYMNNRWPVICYSGIEFATIFKSTSDIKIMIIILIMIMITIIIIIMIMIIMIMIAIIVMMIYIIMIIITMMKIMIITIIITITKMIMIMQIYNMRIYPYGCSRRRVNQLISW